MTPRQASRYVRVQVDEIVRSMNHEAQSRARRAANILRNAAIEVLSKDGTGRRYGRHIASAPGQPPAPDTGNLRRNWRQYVLAKFRGANLQIIARIKSDVPYSEYLERGTRKMAARPYKRKVRSKARPQIEQIYASL